MNKFFSLIGLSISFTVISLWAVGPAFADDTAGKSYISVEENLREMDTDKDGMVSVLEVRAALEARRGKDYEKATLDELVAGASGRSCSTPFAQNFY